MNKRKGYNIIPFGYKYIRTMPEENGITWLCLNDLLSILKCSRFLGSDELQKYCPSCREDIKFKENDENLWGISDKETPDLIRFVLKVNPALRNICDEVLNCTKELSAESNTSQTFILTFENSPALTFTYKERPVTFKTVHGTTYLNATQMAKQFHTSPKQWLRLADTNNIRKALFQSKLSDSINGQVITLQGAYGGTWIEQYLALEFAKWLSPDFEAWCNQCMQKLTEQKLEKATSKEEEPYPEDSCINNPVPKTFSEALRLAARQVEIIEKQNRKIQEDRHKVDFYNDFVENRDYFKTFTIAEELKIPAWELNKFLLEEKILDRYEKKQWYTTPAYAALQCEVPYFWKNRQGKTYIASKAKRWTKAGREFILELWRAKH